MSSDDVRFPYDPNRGHTPPPDPDPIEGHLADLIEAITTITVSTIAGSARLRADLAEGVVRLELLDAVDNNFDGQDPAIVRAIERHVAEVLKALESRGG